ncbi:hypothetical protein [Streptomyces jumonjinensis]|uniref:hypothetical protein n=1 Tax=Streptomyces jumonjinensis TaxID=1945 RepID=UPI0037B16893
MDRRVADKNRNLLGTYLGVAVAVGVLPGLAMEGGSFTGSALIVAGAVFVLLNQLIGTHPDEIRGSSPRRLLRLAAAGTAQDSMILLLISCLAAEFGLGLLTDDLMTVLLGGLIVRAVTLAVLAVPTPPRAPAGTDG